MLGKLKTKPKRPNFTKLIANAVAFLHEKESMFTEQQVIRQVARDAIGLDISAAQIIDETRFFLTSDPNIVPLQKGIEKVYTTRRMLTIEKGLLEAVEQGKKDQSHLVKQRLVAKIVDARLPLGPDLSEDNR